jgi:hypothetical protein
MAQRLERRRDSFQLGQCGLCLAVLQPQLQTESSQRDVVRVRGRNRPKTLLETDPIDIEIVEPSPQERQDVQGTILADQASGEVGCRVTRGEQGDQTPGEPVSLRIGVRRHSVGHRREGPLDLRETGCDTGAHQGSWERHRPQRLLSEGQRCRCTDTPEVDYCGGATHGNPLRCKGASRVDGLDRIGQSLQDEVSQGTKTPSFGRVAGGVPGVRGGRDIGCTPVGRLDRRGQDAQCCLGIAFLNQDGGLEVLGLGRAGHLQQLECSFHVPATQRQMCSQDLAISVPVVSCGPLGERLGPGQILAEIQSVQGGGAQQPPAQAGGEVRPSPVIQQRIQLGNCIGPVAAQIALAIAREVLGDLLRHRIDQVRIRQGRRIRRGSHQGTCRPRSTNGHGEHQQTLLSGGFQQRAKVKPTVEERLRASEQLRGVDRKRRRHERSGLGKTSQFLFGFFDLLLEREALRCI